MMFVIKLDVYVAPAKVTICCGRREQNDRKVVKKSAIPIPNYVFVRHKYKDSR